MIKWTEKDGHEHYWSAEIADMIDYFFKLEPAERLSHLTRIAARVMGCSRCSIILEKANYNHQNGRLILVAGFPADRNAHGIGSEITREYGRDFLKRVIEGGSIVHIANPDRDERVAYMRSLINNCRIKNQLFVPLYYVKQKESYIIPPFGVMAFDYTDKDKVIFDNIAIKARKIAKLVVTFILNDERRENYNQKIFRMACASALSENALGFEDEFRNTAVNLQLSANNLLRVVEELEKEMPSHKLISKIKERLADIEEIIRRHTAKTNDFLTTIRLSIRPNIQEHEVAKFIENVRFEFLEEKKTEGKKLEIHLDLNKLSKDKRLNFDHEKMKIALKAILENALDSKAKNVWIRVLAKDGKRGCEKILIVIANDGERMSQQTGQQLLQYLSSSDRHTGRGGLSIVKSIVRSHGGEVDLKWQAMTQFIIQLPLQ